MANLLPFLKDDSSRPKCYFHHTALPSYIDFDQIPTNRPPFSSINDLKWIQHISISTSMTACASIEKELSKLFPLHYSKAMLNVSDILETSFLSLIKTKPLTLLSSTTTRDPTETAFSLTNGILSIEVDKATYQRCGIVGTPNSAGGRKHKDNRYIIQTDLRAPSMLHGKKGFERFVYAAKNVLCQNEVCLIAGKGKVYGKTFGGSDGKEDAGEDDEVNKLLEKHKPIGKTVELEFEIREGIKTPGLLRQAQSVDHINDLETLIKDSIYLSDLEDWISLLAIDSPRIKAHDGVDAYISRYQVPDDYAGTEVTDIAHADINGFMSSSSLTQMFLAIRKSRDSHWVAIQAKGFRGDASTILFLPGREQCLVWEHPSD